MHAQVIDVKIAPLEDLMRLIPLSDNLLVMHILRPGTQQGSLALSSRMPLRHGHFCMSLQRCSLIAPGTCRIASKILPLLRSRHCRVFAVQHGSTSQTQWCAAARS